jgi:murein DD-endopeptidase MepM/ murein hydrolase activator NlpD
VREGDTLWKGAIEMGLDLGEAGCAVSPTFTLEQPLIVGDRLHAPGHGLICHQVEPEQTPAQIAKLYGIAPADLIGESWNRLSAEDLDRPLGPGTHVRVPVSTDPGELADPSNFMAYMLEQPVSVSPYLAYATGGPRAKPTHEPVPASWPYGSGQFEWPVYGWLSQGYRSDHRAIDIAAKQGTFVTASDRGVVIRAGWNNQGYGRFVVIDHNIDYITLYAHLEQIFVQEGEVVGKGQILGTVGSTGNSTGPHLHFEIRDFGRRTNPIELLAR